MTFCIRIDQIAQQETEQRDIHHSHLTDNQVAEIERRLANADRQFVSFATVREDFRRRGRAL